MNLFTAKKLTELRKHFSFSQETLAEKVGVSRQAISKWERGEASPDTDNLLMLSKIYNVSLDDLLGEKTAEEIIAAKEKQNTAPLQENCTDKTAEDNAKKQNEDVTNSEKVASGENKKDLPKLGKDLLKFPYFIVAIILFLIMGFSSKLWHPGWMIFLTVPAYYLTAWAFLAKTKKKMLLKLPVYLYAVILYILMGFTASLWHPMWLVFLCIPVYYWFVATNFSDKKN